MESNHSKTGQVTPRHRRALMLRRAAAILALAAACIIQAGAACAASGMMIALPRRALPAGMLAYLRARIEGADVYVCTRTDALAWAWQLRSASASLSDLSGHALGRFSNRVTITPPRSWSEITWQDVSGGTVTAVRNSSDFLTPDRRTSWVRYDVQSHAGNGPFAAARAIVRMSTVAGLRPSRPCDAAHVGLEAKLSFSGYDSFLK